MVLGTQEEETYLVGVIQHPDTSLWQVWFARDGKYAFLTALKKQQSAVDMVEVIRMDIARDHKSRGMWLQSLFAFLAGASQGDVVTFPSPRPDWMPVEAGALLEISQSRG